MTANITPTVSILTFNRPEYLTALLESLKNQSIELKDENLYVLIDGYKDSRAEGRREPDRTDEINKIVKRFFPESNTLNLKTNNGTARSFGILRQWTYQNSKSHWVHFFEDDIVLHNNYLEVIDVLIKKIGSINEVAQISGFWINEKNGFTSRSNKLLHASFGTKAFAERHVSFKAFEQDYLRYLNIMAGVNYHQRNYSDIVEKLLESNYITPQIQQDCFIEFLLNKHDLVHVTTKLELAIDRGKKGSNNRRGSLAPKAKFPSTEDVKNLIYEIQITPISALNEQIKTISKQNKSNELELLKRKFVNAYEAESLAGSIKLLKIALMRSLGEKINYIFRTLKKLL